MVADIFTGSVTDPIELVYDQKIGADGGALWLTVEMDEAVLDDIIRRLVDAKNGRTVRQVHLTESEIRQLCVASKEIFLSQPNLLELEAPIKICGKRKSELSEIYLFSLKASMVSLMLFLRLIGSIGGVLCLLILGVFMLVSLREIDFSI
ncbi:hypothetical protein Ancab_015348 [Ancistrocladus abbreviatus]